MYLYIYIVCVDANVGDVRVIIKFCVCVGFSQTALKNSMIKRWTHSLIASKYVCVNYGKCKI